MERMANLTFHARGVRVLALASIFVMVACGGGGGGGTGEGGTGVAGKLGTGGSGGKGGGAGGTISTGGNGTGGNGTGGIVGTGGEAGSIATGGTGGTAGVPGTGGGAGLTGGSGGAAGSAGASGAAGMDAAAGSGATDAGSDSRPDGGNGGACTSAAGCLSGFCVDGVCCETACAGTCNACSSAKTGAADGLCRPITAGKDPDNECAAEAQTSCGLDGVCDGAGACRKWINGTACSSESCSGSTDTPARTCDGTGTCRAATTASCGNYVCGATSCKTSCLSNADCSSTTFCSAAGHCIAPQTNGGSCTAASQCANGHCVDGVCCESACGAACNACSSAKTGAADGLCRPVTAGTDPDSECAADPIASCGHDGTCDGAGACRLYVAGTGCTNESCSGATDTLPRKCDGAGTCLAATTASCAPYMCGATACATTCTADTDCAAGYFCSAGACTVKETNGTACGAAGACQSGFCVDGVCCETACTGACMTCGGVGTLGQCTPAVSGTDVRNDCTAALATSCGNDGTCDGAGACRKWAAGTTCGAAACTGGTLLPVPACNGAGACVAGTPSSCGVYQCSATSASCKTSCTSDADCNNGFCSAGTCVASNSVTPVNLAGNGNAEYNATSGWVTSGGSLALQTGAGLVHGGTYSLANTGRTQNYMGPSYALPTGAGKYNITAWGMQNTDPTFTSAAVQLALTCGSPGVANYGTAVGGFGISLPQGVWTKFSGTVDLTVTTGCDPSMTGGVVDSVSAYLNQTGTEGPTLNPDLFIDDLVVTVTDGHNLVGNPNFEAGTTAGWSQTGGTMAISTAQAHGGTNSLVDAGRTQNYQGQKWNLPIGTAQYKAVFYALHTGSLPHTLMLQPVYTCGTGGQQFPSSVGVASNVAGGTWNQLSATVTFPPADAPAGCQLTSAGLYVQQEGGTCGTGAGQIECPDIYVDDVSITLAP
jgi:hypothetical protein